MTFYCSQALYDKAIAEGLDMRDWAVLKPMPRVPRFEFQVRTDIVVKRQRENTAQWKRELHGNR